MIPSSLRCGDSALLLKDYPEDSIDSLITDAPYGLSFMNKVWDKDVPSIDLWKECLRVLKSGAFGFIMSSPRADVHAEMIKRLEAAGFNIAFTPIYWTYLSGFPKPLNIAKKIDRDAGHEIGHTPHPGRQNRSYETISNVFSQDRANDKLSRRKSPFAGDHNGEWDDASISNEFGSYTPIESEAKQFDGMYGGFQPKPAVEVIIVVQKPLSEKTYVEQVRKNEKGGTYLDRGRIPAEYTQLLKNAQKGYCTPGDSGIYEWNTEYEKVAKKMVGGRASNPITFGGEDTGYKVRLPYNRGSGVAKDETDSNNKGWNNDDYNKENAFMDIDLRGRFPANLLVSDDVLGFLSEYFSLDAWWEFQLSNLTPEQREIFPFIYAPKPTKEEKDKGISTLPRVVEGMRSNCGPALLPKTCTDGRKTPCDVPNQRGRTKRANYHPTVKSIELMSYLIAISPTKAGDIILDPFAGSGSTPIACKLADRRYLAIELNPEYYEIMKARVNATHVQKSLFRYS